MTNSQQYILQNVVKIIENISVPRLYLTGKDYTSIELQPIKEKLNSELQEIDIQIKNIKKALLAIQGDNKQL